MQVRNQQTEELTMTLKLLIMKSYRVSRVITVLVGFSPISNRVVSEGKPTTLCATLVRAHERC